jgi:hypothetical protein
MASHVKRVVSLAVIFAFAGNFLSLPAARAQEFTLPQPGVMVRLSPEFNSPILKGIKVHTDNPFRFDFILDQGDSRLNSARLKEESSKLIKYFLASLTIPDKDLWVNLSPYEKDRIIPQSFGMTQMGRDLLAEDYMLKQITASLIYPEDETGRKFWKRVYEEAARKYGTTDIPVNTFNKVWIVPQKAVVYENAKAGTALVAESSLKVMLEQDYMALSHNVIPAKAGLDNVNAMGSQIVREIVIPQLTKEVNEDKNFAQLRQVYNSLILAAWYKKKIKDSILQEVYANKNKTDGIQYTSTVIPVKAGIHYKNDIDALYQEYLKAFKKGVYNYIKEEHDPLTQQVVPRRYFSGGLDLAMGATSLSRADLTVIQADKAMNIKKLLAYGTLTTALIISAGLETVNYTIGDSIKLAYHYRYPYYDVKTLRDQAAKIEAQLNVNAFNPIKFDTMAAIRHFTADSDVFQAVIPIIRPMLHDQIARVARSQGKSSHQKELTDLDSLLAIAEGLNSTDSDIGRMKVLAQSLKTVPKAKKENLINAINNLSGVYMKGEYDPQKPTIMVVDGFMGGGLGVQKTYIDQIKDSYNVAFLYYDSWSQDELSARMLAKTLRSYPFGKKFVLAGNSNGGDVIRLMILENSDLDFSNVLLLEFVCPYGGASMAEFGRFLPPLTNYLDMKVITADQYPYGGMARFIFADKNLKAVAARVYKQVSFSVKGDKYAPKYFNSEFFKQTWKNAYGPGEHIIVPMEVGVNHRYLAQQKPVVASVLLLLMGFEQGSRPVGSIFKSPNFKSLDMYGFLRQKYGPGIIGKNDINWGQVILNGKVEPGEIRKYFGFEGNDWLKNANANTFRISPSVHAAALPADHAQISPSMKAPGGIDLNTGKMDLRLQNENGEIRFKIDPAMLRQMQKASGFVPVIIDIQPLRDIPLFLGLNDPHFQAKDRV